MRLEDLKTFIKIPTLYTDRLTLRKITLADLDDVYEYSRKPETSRYLLWYPHESRGYTRAHLGNVERRYKRGEFYDWGIELDGRMIGTVGFTSFSVENGRAEIGYVLDSDFWGRGIATEATRRIIRYGFEELKLNRIEARFISENSASLRVAERCGMHYEGCMREAMLVKGRYVNIGIAAILRSEYSSDK